MNQGALRKIFSLLFSGFLFSSPSWLLAAMADTDWKEVRIIVNVPFFTEDSSDIFLTGNLDLFQEKLRPGMFISCLNSEGGWRPDCLKLTKMAKSHLKKYKNDPVILDHVWFTDLMVPASLDEVNLKVVRDGVWNKEETSVHSQWISGHRIDLFEQELDISDWMTSRTRSEFVIDVMNWKDKNGYRDVSWSETLHSSSPDKKVVLNGTELFIHLPNSYYSQPEKSYPVVIFHDGQKISNPWASGESGSWGINEILEKENLEAIIVGVGVDELQRDRLYDFSTPEGQKYAQFIATELPQYLKANFRVKDGRENQTLVGSSMGAAISIWIASYYSEVFSRVIALSLFTSCMTSEGSYPLTNPRYPVKIYIDSGDQNIEWDYVPAIKEFMRAHKGHNRLTMFSTIVPYAQHNEFHWARRIAPLLKASLKSKNTSL